MPNLNCEKLLDLCVTIVALHTSKGYQSVKFRFKRIVANVFVTYEALTLLIQIEAVINSRLRLTPLSKDPSDHQILISVHFLIGESLTNLLESDVKDLPANRLSSIFRIVFERRSCSNFNYAPSSAKKDKTK